MLFHVFALHPHFCTFLVPSLSCVIFHFLYTATFSMAGGSVCWTRNKKGTSITKMMSQVRDQNSKLLFLCCPKLSFSLQHIFFMEFLLKYEVKFTTLVGQDNLAN